MKIIKKMKVSYQHLEHIHKKYGLVLHGSVFIFSLLLGIGIGTLILLINVAQANHQRENVRNYEHQIMNQLVKRIEAASPR